MQKKAQGLSLNTIIVAIIVLIVLVVLIMIFTGYFGTRFTPEVTSCSNAGGTCTFDDDCGTDAFGSPRQQLRATCPTEGQICCSLGVGSGGEQADASGCGLEGAAPCPASVSSEPCNTGLEVQNGKCIAPATV